MPDIVRKSPPHLKFLAERRARALNEVNVLREAAVRTADKLAAAETTLSELDAQIGRIESRIDPSWIEAIRPQAPYRHTPHGHLRTAILEILRAAGPVSTSEVADEVQARYQIEFHSEQDRRVWRHNSIGKQLRLYLKAGLVERIGGKRRTRWHLKRDTAPSPDSLKVQAETRGAGIQDYDAFHE